MLSAVNQSFLTAMADISIHCKFALVTSATFGKLCNRSMNAVSLILLDSVVLAVHPASKSYLYDSRILTSLKLAMGGIHTPVTLQH
jgi:hypothetical protein